MVIFDIFFQEIKLSALHAKQVEHIAETEQEMAAAVVNAAKKTLMPQAILRSVLHCLSLHVANRDGSDNDIFIYFHSVYNFGLNGRIHLQQIGIVCCLLDHSVCNEGRLL